VLDESKSSLLLLPLERYRREKGVERSIAELRAFYGIMYLLFIWGGKYGFGWEEIQKKGRLKGGALKVETFFGPKKVEFITYRPHPLRSSL
jgi:hypothetical protein